MQDQILHERARPNLSGINEKFHDQFEPLSTHLTSTPESYVLEKSVTDIGGPGQKSGKSRFSLIIIHLRLRETPINNPLIRRADSL